MQTGVCTQVISLHLANSGSVFVAYLMVVKTIGWILAHVLYERLKVAWHRKGG